jgi:L-2-hydroxyglutarate oxidase LhgO
VFDVLVVGGGVVGLATARAIVASRPDLSVAVLEKESRVARHQTGRNSGVLHSGLYYRPGSNKARLCVEGRLAMERFCTEHGVPFERCGKVVVAVGTRELPRLDELERRGAANGVRAERIGPERLREIEPHAAGIAALHVPETGVVDFGRVAEALAADIAAHGVDVRLGHELVDVDERTQSVTVETDRGALSARALVNCAGLHSDEVAAADGVADDVRIVPFRGEYHSLVPRAASLVRHLVYPVPDPDLPFLGVHVSRGIDDEVHVGPNAVLALRREGYSWGDVGGRELARLARFPGFWRMAARWWPVGVVEVYRSFSRTALARAVSRLVPGIGADDLVPHRAGVRAQAVARDGTLLDDFVIRQTRRSVHVLNAPSPAATASLKIGETIATSVIAKLDS